MLHKPRLLGTRTMTHKAIYRAAVLLACVALLIATTHAAPAKPRFPTWDEVDQATLKFFDEQPNFGAGEIISQSQVRGLFEELKRMGWTLPKPQKILDLVPGDNETLVRDMRTADGRKFAKQISGLPNAYDRLDRLIRMPTGRSAVARLIKGPDGVWLLQYMTEDPGGAAMGRMLSNTPTGKDFNRPTGRIYMVPELINELRGAYPKAPVR